MTGDYTTAARSMSQGIVPSSASMNSSNAASEKPRHV